MISFKNAPFDRPAHQNISVNLFSFIFMQAALQISFSFQQVRSLVQQLSDAEKHQLLTDLQREMKASELSRILESFKTDELHDADIDQTVEDVRTEMYHGKKQP